MNDPLGPRVGHALQINMHPLDVDHVVETLPHQLRAWRGQVDRVVITLDHKVSTTGRYHAADYNEKLARLAGLLERQSGSDAAIHVDLVDYSSEAIEAVRQRFFSAEPSLPLKAFDGGPFYAYFYGLYRANAERVLHMDSDMLFGGMSQRWMAEADAVFDARPGALFVCPFSGPPRADGTIDESLHVGFPGRRAFVPPQWLGLDVPAYGFNAVSTRIFVLDMRRFVERIGSLPLVRPDFKRRLRAHLLDQSPLTMPAEEVLSASMERLGLERVDLLGGAPGMFSLHPPYRNPAFYRQLPELIRRTESSDLPDGQLGDFDVNASMIDWSDALAAKSRPARLKKALRQLIAANRARLLGQ